MVIAKKARLKLAGHKDPERNFGVGQISILDFKAIL